MANKLIDNNDIERLAKGLDQRSKTAVENEKNRAVTRENELQTSIDSKLTQPEDGVSGQILSLAEDGSTEWIDNAKQISTDEIDNMMKEIFKEEVETENEIVEVNKLKMITTTQIDDIIDSVF